MNSICRALYLSLLAIAGVSSSSQAAAACAQGYDSRECLRQRAVLQEELNGLYVEQEVNLSERLEDYDEGFREEAVKALRETNRAYAVYKDAECYSKPLADGMSFKDASVMADECQVKWRKALVGTLRSRSKSQAK